MEDSPFRAGIKGSCRSPWKYFASAVSLFAFSLAPAFAHDASEITTSVFLRTNSMEIRVTLAASTAIALMAADGHQVEALNTAADLESARPVLNVAAGELFQISAAGKILAASSTNVALSVEDHIEVRLIYPRPDPGTLRFDAVHLKKLPADASYGALLTVVDLANDVFLRQKLLTAADPVLDVEVQARPTPVASLKTLMPPDPKDWFCVRVIVP